MLVSKCGSLKKLVVVDVDVDEADSKLVRVRVGNCGTKVENAYGKQNKKEIAQLGKCSNGVWWSMISKAQGIGLRSEHQSILSTQKVTGIDFLKLSPENWMGLGGFKSDYLDKVAERYPIIAHGLSLSIGGFRPLNKKFLNEIRAFLDD